MTTGDLLEFKLTERLRFCQLSRPVTLQLSDHHRVELRREDDGSDATITSFLTAGTPRDVLAALDDVAAKRLPAGTDLSDVPWFEQHLDEAKARVLGDHGVPWKSLPAEVRQFCEDRDQGLYLTNSRVLNLLTWRTTPTLYRERSRGVSFWRRQHGAWSVLPGNFGVVIDPGFEMPLSFFSDDILKAALDGGEDQPVAHELLREADLIHTTSPRSAQLMAAVAVEVGVKALIRRLQPQTDWLLTNTHSPPVLDFLHKYLPTLPVRFVAGQGTPLLTGRGRKKLEALVRGRNTLAHAGAFNLDLREQLHEIAFARSILYLCDFHAGAAWAWPHVQVALKEGVLELAPPSQHHRRISPTHALRIP